MVEIYETKPFIDMKSYDCWHKFITILICW